MLDFGKLLKRGGASYQPEGRLGNFLQPYTVENRHPDRMGFDILNESLNPKYITEGSVQSQVRPLRCIPMKWVAEITLENAPNYSIDNLE